MLIHDAQYTDAEYETRVGWGHSTIGHALAFAELARVGRFVPFHHDPSHDDDMLDDFFADAPRSDRAGFDVVPAHEGDVFEVSARVARG